MRTANHKHPIVLLHGFLSDSSYWKKLTPYLRDAGYEVYAIDLLGFGTAPKPHDASYDYDAHLAYIDSTLDTIQIDKPFTLIGHSMGALLAARYAIVHKIKVSKVVLLNPPLYIDSAQAYATLRETSLVYRLLLDSRHSRIGWTLLRFSAFRFIKSHSHTSRELSLKNIIQKPQVFDDLARTNKETMVLIGTKDRPVYMANVAFLAKNPLVTLSVENVSHHASILKPVLVQRKILDFIQPAPR